MVTRRVGFLVCISTIAVLFHVGPAAALVGDRLNDASCSEGIVAVCFNTVLELGPVMAPTTDLQDVIAHVGVVRLILVDNVLELPSGSTGSDLCLLYDALPGECEVVIDVPLTAVEPGLGPEDELLNAFVGTATVYLEGDEIATIPSFVDLVPVSGTPGEPGSPLPEIGDCDSGADICTGDGYACAWQSGTQVCGGGDGNGGVYACLDRGTTMVCISNNPPQVCVETTGGIEGCLDP